MIEFKLKFFSSQSRTRENRLARFYNESMEEWLEANPNLFVIDYELKSLEESGNEKGTVLIVKYRDSTKRNLMIEKE